MPLDATKTVFKEPAAKEWALLPEDTYQVEITDIKEKTNEYKGEKKQVLEFEFTIIEQHTFESGGRKCYTYGRRLWKKGAIVKPVPSTNNKDPLTYKVCSAVSGRKLTKEEGESWTIAQLNSLIGRQLRIGVSISAPTQDGRQFNNVDAFYAIKALLSPFNEKQVVEDEPIPAAKPTPADIVAQASGGKFIPRPEVEPIAEVGDIDVEDIPV